MNLVVNTDGASRGNPGPASYGFVIKEKNGPILHQEGKVIGVTTNNVAEYTAVLSALKYISKFLANKMLSIEIVTDSQLIARQLDGSFKIKSENLKELYTEIKRLEANFNSISYRNVPREENFLADKLANLALDNE